MTSKQVVLANEADVKGIVKKVCGILGIHYTMPVMMGYGKSGTPDFLCCINGLYVSIETKYDSLRHRETKGKVKRGGPTPSQQLAMDSIRKAGGLTLVVDMHNVLELESFLGRVQEYAHGQVTLRDVASDLRYYTGTAFDNFYYDIVG